MKIWVLRYSHRVMGVQPVLRDTLPFHGQPKGTSSAARLEKRRKYPPGYSQSAQAERGFMVDIACIWREFGGVTIVTPIKNGPRVTQKELPNRRFPVKIQECGTQGHPALCMSHRHTSVRPCGSTRRHEFVPGKCDGIKLVDVLFA